MSQSYNDAADGTWDGSGARIFPARNFLASAVIRLHKWEVSASRWCVAEKMLLVAHEQEKMSPVIIYCMLSMHCYSSTCGQMKGGQKLLFQFKWMRLIDTRELVLLTVIFFSMCDKNLYTSGRRSGVTKQNWNLSNPSGRMCCGWTLVTIQKCIFDTKAAPNTELTGKHGDGVALIWRKFV